MRKILNALAIMVMIAGITACGNSGKTDDGKKKIKIGFIVKDPSEQWFQLEWKFAQECADKYGFELIKLPAEDGKKALDALDSLKTSGVQGFVICTPEVGMGPAITSKAKELEMKFMTVDDQFVNAKREPMTEVHHLGISARKIGEVVGKALYDEMIKRKWTIEETGVCVVTWEQLDTAKERTDGEIDALIKAGFPKARIFKTAQKTLDLNGAMNATNAVLVREQSVKHWLVTGMNDTAAMGAVRALESGGIPTADIVGISIGGTDSLVEFKKKTPSGLIASVLLGAKEHGYLTTEMIYKWISEGKEPPKDTRTAGTLITRENFRQVYTEQGLADKL